AKTLAKKIFHEVAVAEAHVHGSTLQKVHFHEVGAIDSIGDIVGVAIAMSQLEIDKVTSSPIPTGTGFITIAHGRVSVPAPATAEILRGVPLASTNINAELTTPTGAAIVKATAESFGAVPAMTIDAIGYGAGTRDLETQANLLRALIGNEVHGTATSAKHQTIEHDHVHVMETQVDDATGEELAVASEKIMDAGALDCFFSPVQMKKGRPGTLLTAVAADEKASAVRDAIFLNTSTIGIRTNQQSRAKLIRREVTFDHQGTTVRAKEVELPNGNRRRKFEAADIERLTSETGRSFRELTEELSRL
ncbi:MAG: nickel pincer cofactor biosynthesis protein LarC, partial [Planctomycetota bacterium]